MEFKRNEIENQEESSPERSADSSCESGRSSSREKADPAKEKMKEEKHIRKLISKPIHHGKTSTTILYEVVASLNTPMQISYFQLDTGAPRVRNCIFTIECFINERLYSTGSGMSKKVAKQEASRIALEKLCKENPKIEQEMERIIAGQPSARKMRRKRHASRNGVYNEYPHRGSLTFQERRLLDMELEMSHMVHNLENLSTVLRMPSMLPSIHDRYFCDRDLDFYNYNHSYNYNHDSYNYPLMTPHESTLEFMQNRSGRHVELPKDEQQKCAAPSYTWKD